MKANEFTVKTVSARHRKYTDFTRTATVVLDNTGNELQMGLVQYSFLGEEHTVSPHKHSLSKKPYIPTTPSTRKPLKQEVQGAKGPSTIFDETVERVGGIIGCQEMADMPRDKKQVINARATVTSKEKEDEFTSLLTMAKTDPTVRNLQWTPSPRVILCDNEQIKDIIEECCKLNSATIVSIDTTFNIGDFYVTSTTYQSSKFSNADTRKRANLPGPAMLHAKKGKRDYQVFCHALLEIDENVELINYVVGDRDKAQAGFMIPLKGATFLPCKKHVQDDIRKLTELSLGPHKETIISDIFGNETKKEKGLIDSVSKDDFLEKADVLYSKWDNLEKEVRPGSHPEFSTYFRRHIEEDMATGMILPVRRSAGLRDEFFYNNAQECFNFKFKSKILEKKMVTGSGYRPNIKCTWIEAITAYKEFLECTRRDHLVTLSPSLKHLERNAVEWSKMTESARLKHVQRLNLSLTEYKDEFCLPASNLPAAECTATSASVLQSTSEENETNTIGPFEVSGLPEFLKGSWENAKKIVNLGGVGPHPSDSSKRCVLSLSQPITHTVTASRSSFKCDSNCPRYKECSICAHTIAVAHGCQKLSEFLKEYKVPLKKMVADCVPVGSGKKENEKKMSRKRKSYPERDLSDYGDRISTARLPKPVEVNDDNTPYEVVFVKDTAATTCYGCKGKVRERPSDTPPPPPYDIFIRHLERRVYNRRGETKLNVSKTPEMVYYHPTKRCCINLQNGKELIMSDEVRKSLTEAHCQLLWRDFEFRC